MEITPTHLPVEGGALPLTVVRGGGTGAAVVIVPSAFGIADDLIEQMAELAADARVVVAFDQFFRGDAGVIPYGDMARVMSRVRSLDRPRCLEDLRAVLTWTGRPALVVGICIGGAFALMAAVEGLVDGAVTWHGTRMEGQLERAAEVKCPLRLHFGELDPITPPAVVEAMRTAFIGHDDFEVVVHPGATHGFSHRTAPAYQPAAEQACLAAVRGLLRQSNLK